MVGTEGLEPSTDSRGISSALSPTELCPQIKNGTGERTRTSRTMGLNHVPMPIRLHPLNLSHEVDQSQDAEFF